MSKTGDDFVEYVQEQLGNPPGLEARAMFGGHGLYRDGVFFGIVYHGQLFLKTSNRTLTNYTDRGCKPFQPNEKQTLKSYYEVPTDIMEDRTALRQWADGAVRDAAEL